MTATIRKVRASDLQALVKIDEALFGADSFSSYALRSFINLFPESFFVAERNGDVVGYAVIGVQPFSSDAWLISMGVSAAYQKSGVGSGLLTACDEYCKASSIGSCRLTTDPDNTGAIALYKKFGFKADAELRDYYAPGDRKLVMVKGYEV